MLSYIIVTIIVSVTLISQCQTRRITQWRRQSNGRTFRKDYTYREAGKSFYKYHTITKNWADAKKVCLGEKAELFYAINKKEADDVIKFWKSKGSDSWRMYVGISDIVTEGKFVTIHGRPISEVYYLWEKGQPDNWKGEDCVVINKRGEMNDVQCSLSLNFMCKRTLESLPKTTTKKPTTTTKKATTTTKKATTTTKKATTTTTKPTTTTKKATTTTKKPTTTTKKATTTTTTKPTTTTKKATTTTTKPTTTTKKATTTTTKPTTTTKKATTTTTKPTTTTTKATTTTTKATTTTTKPTTTTKRATTTTKSTSSCKMQSNNTAITLKTFVFWPNATVPFYINPDHFGEDQIRVILESLAMFEFETCIKFAPLMVAPVEGQHVMTFINPKGVRRCTIETNGHSNYSPHLIQLGYSCLDSRELNTIIMRALGLPFEHNRACRDVYIDVWIENIEPSYIQLFTKDCNLPIELRNIPYDLFSIMHFGERDYSKNGHRTIRIKNEIVVQARDGISSTDIKKIGLTASDIKKLALIYGPECRTRDRAEQIAKCRTYPGVTRRKRENRQWATKPMGASRPGMQKTMTTRRTYYLRGTEASLKFLHTTSETLVE